MSLLAFAVLALLSWLTLSNDPIVMRDTVLGFDVSIRFRSAVLVVLALLASLTTVAFWRTTMEERRDEASQQE